MVRSEHVGPSQRELRSRCTQRLRRDGEEVRVAGVLDRHDTDAEELAGGGAEGDVGALVEVDGGLAEHGVVLQLRATERRSVARDEDELGCARGRAKRSARGRDEVEERPEGSPLPERIALRVDLYPSEYLPDLMTSASLALMLSADFFVFF